MPKARNEARSAAPQEEEAGPAKETQAERSEAPEAEPKGSFREKLSAFKEKAGDWLKGRYSQEELNKQEMAVSLKAEMQESQGKVNELLEALKNEGLDEVQREILEKELATAREELDSDKEDLDRVQGGMAKTLLKGTAKAVLTTGAVMAGLKFFPDAIRYAVQRREVSKERERITEALEGDTENVKVDLGLRFDDMVERVKESRHLSVEKRNELLKRLDAVKAARDSKLMWAESWLAEKVIEAQAGLLVDQGKFDDVLSKFQAEEKAKLLEKGVNETAAQVLAESAAKDFAKAHAVAALKGEDADAQRAEVEEKLKNDPEAKKQYEATVAAHRAERDKVDQEAREKLRGAIDEHVTTQVKGAEVAKQFINTAAMASGFGILRTVGYAGAAVVERYTRLKGEKAKEMGIEEKDAKVSVMKDVFLGGFTETMKELAFKGGTTKTEKALKFVKALGITARAAGIAGIGLGELAGSGHSFSKAFEKVSDQWGQVWDKSDGPVDTMKNVAGQMVGNGVKNVENMAGFYKKVFSGELWHRVMGSEAPPAAAGAAAGVSAAEAGPNQSIAETGPVAPPSPETNQHLMELASVRKGEGITHAIVRQLEDDPQKYGYKGDLGDKAALDKWAVLQSKKIAIDSGFIRPDGTETRVRGGGSYLLEKDQGGKLVAHKVGTEGKEYTWFRPRVPKVAEVPVAERPQLPKDWRAATERLTGGQPDAALDERVGQNLPAGDRGAEAVDEVRGALTERFKTLEQGIGERQAELGKVTQQLRLELEKPQPDRELLQRLGGRQHELRGQINDLEKTANAYYESFLRPRAVEEVPDTSTGRRPIVPLGERAEGRVPEVVPGAVEQSVPPTLEVRGNAAELLKEQGVHIEGNTVRLDSGREFALNEVGGVRTERLVVTEVRGSDGRELRIQALNSDGSAETIKVRDGVVIEERHVSAALRSAIAEQPLIKGVAKMTEEMQRPAGPEGAVPVSRPFSELPAGRQADIEASIRGLELKQHNLSEDQVRGLATRFATEPAFGRNYRLEQVVLGESYLQNKMSKDALMRIINDPKQGYDQNRAAQWALGKMGVETGIRSPGRIVEAASAGAVEQAVPAGRMGHVEAGGVDVRFQYGTDGKVIDAVEQGDMAAVRTQGERTILQEHWRGVVGQKSFDLGKAWEGVRQTVTEAQADKNAYDRLVASGQGSSPEAQFLKQQYESKLAGLRQRYGEDLFRKDMPPKVDLSAVTPGQEVGRIGMPHGEARFRYSDGKVVGVGLEMRTMSPEDLDRLNGQLREGWVQRLGSGPKADLGRSVILNRSREVFSRTLALEALNNAGRGNTPEARYLTRSINVLVAETEEKYGDVFK